MSEPYLLIKFNGELITGSLAPLYISHTNRVSSRQANGSASHELPHTYALTCPPSTVTTYSKWTLDAYELEGLKLELDYDKYFPYDDGQGNPIYDEDSGAILRDPITGEPV